MILLNDDIIETKTSYLLIQKEENGVISGVEIKPIFYDRTQRELIILESKIKIKKNEMFSDHEICVGRKMIILKDGKKLIANSSI